AVIHGVVPRLDPVQGEGPAERLGGARRVSAEPDGELFVVDRIARQESAGTSDVGLVHEVHSATRRAARAWADVLSCPARPVLGRGTQRRLKYSAPAR